MGTILGKYKGILIFMGISAVSLVVFMVVRGGAGNTEPVALVGGQQRSESEQVVTELLSLLTSLRTLDLDETIFTDRRFISLTDFSVALTAQPIGRTNPFAPLGRGDVEDERE